MLYYSFIHSRLLKSYCLNILQYRRLLIHKETHGSYLQLMVPYEFCPMTPNSNCTNKWVFRKDSSPGIPWDMNWEIWIFHEIWILSEIHISERCESISCCDYRIVFWKHLLNNLILALFIILLSLIYNSKRKKLWSIYMQYISKSVLKISATRCQLLLDTQKKRWRILIMSYCLNSWQ